jgi:preprotein translocase subunit SecD
LYFFGGPLVRGFAVTLMLGIFATVVAGCFFLRAIFDFCTDVLGFKNISI